MTMSGRLVADIESACGTMPPSHHGISSLRSDIPSRLRRAVLIKQKELHRINSWSSFCFISGERGIRTPGTVTRTSV